MHSFKELVCWLTVDCSPLATISCPGPWLERSSFCQKDDKRGSKLQFFLFIFFISRLFTDVRCVIEPLTWCNELSPGRDCRQDQLQFAESFPDSWKLRRLRDIICHLLSVRHIIGDFCTSRASTVCFSVCRQSCVSCQTENFILDPHSGQKQHKLLPFTQLFSTSFLYNCVKIKQNQTEGQGANSDNDIS